MRLFPKEKFNFRLPLSKDTVINMMKKSFYNDSIKLNGKIINDTFHFIPLNLFISAPIPVINGQVIECDGETCVSGVIRMSYFNIGIELIITLSVLYAFITLNEPHSILFGIVFILIGRIIYRIRKDKMIEEFTELFGLDINDIKNTIDN